MEREHQSWRGGSWRHHRCCLALLPNIRWDPSARYSPVRALCACGWQAELHLALKSHRNLSSRQRFSTLSQQWVWRSANIVHPHLLTSIHICSQHIPITSPSLSLDLHSQWKKAPANNKISYQWNSCCSVFYQVYFLEAIQNTLFLHLISYIF